MNELLNKKAIHKPDLLFVVLPNGKHLKIFDTDKFIVTGLLYNSNKRFKSVYSSLWHALSINLWNGSVWHERDGKRTLIRRVFN